MARSIPFTFDDAERSSAAKFDDSLKMAVGDFQRALRALLEDSSIDDPTMLALVGQLRAALTNRETLAAILSGNAPKPPKALGGGSPSGDIDDLQDELDAAQEKLRKLESDRKALEEVLHAFDMSALPSADSHYDGNDLRNKARSKKTDIERAASAAPADFVKKDEIKPPADAAKTALQKARDAMGGAKKLDQSDFDVITHALETILRAVS